MVSRPGISSHFRRGCSSPCRGASDGLVVTVRQAQAIAPPPALRRGLPWGPVPTWQPTNTTEERRCARRRERPSPRDREGRGFRFPTRLRRRGPRRNARSMSVRQETLGVLTDDGWYLVTLVRRNAMGGWVVIAAPQVRLPARLCQGGAPRRAHRTACRPRPAEGQGH